MQDLNVFLKNAGLNSFNDLLKFITSSECSDELAITAEAVLDRLRCASPKRKTILTSSIEVGTYLADKLIGHKQEELWALYIDNSNHIIAEKKLFQGTLNRSIAHPREIFRWAVIYGCSGIFIAHNHPSGKLTPSASDLELTESLRQAAKMMKIDGHVFPASNEPLTLNAEFVDGTTESGETEITSKDKRIKRVWVTDTDSDEEPRAVLPVLASIMQADAVVLGPGSLFTSILPNLMISNLGEAVRETDAEVIYICNIMTQRGETDHFSDAEHVEVINNHLGGHYINTALVNGAKIDMSKFHPEDYDAYLEPVRNDFEGLRAQECRVITDDFIDQRHGLVFHDGEKVAKEIINLAFESMSRKRMKENDG